MKLPTPKERASLFGAAQRRKETERNIRERARKKEEEARKQAEIEKARPKIDSIKRNACSAVIKAVEEGEDKAYARTFGYEQFVYQTAGQELIMENVGYTVERSDCHKFIEYHHNDMHHSPDSVNIFETALVISWKNS